MKDLVEILHTEGCSLVVRDTQGEVTIYSKKGVRDLIWLLDNAPEKLRGAWIADKVIGKAAAGLVAVGGVSALYAEVLSLPATEVLKNAGIAYTYGVLVEKIIIPEGDTRCPLEEIVSTATTPKQIEALLREHFEEMKRKKQ